MTAGESIDGAGRNSFAAQLKVSRDEIDVSVSNLEKLELARVLNVVASALSPYGREFLPTVSN